MSANATASLTIRAKALGQGEIKSLAASLGKLSAAAGRASGAQGVGRMGGRLRATGAAVGGTATKVKHLHDEIDRLGRRAYNERITTKAKAILDVKSGGRTAKGIRSVREEMERLERVNAQRANTNAARRALDMPRRGGILAGHGFVTKGRQTLGLIRDTTVAAMGMRYAIGAVAHGVGAAVNPMRDFNQIMAQVKTKGGFTDAEVADIAHTARKQGQTTQFGARESGSAAIELAASGLRPDEIAKQLPTVLQFALAGDIDTEQASGVMVETMSQFGMHAEQFEHIGDVIVKAANMSTISVHDLAESMKYVGPVAKSAGVEFEDLSAMVALLGERGIKGSMAGTSLRRVIKSLSIPAKQAKKAMKAIGLSEADLQEGLSDIPKFLIKLDETMKAKGMNKAQRLAISGRLFGAEGMAAVEALMKTMTDTTDNGRTAWENYRDAMHAADGDMKKTAKVMGDTLDGKIKKLEASIESAQIALGEGLAPVLTKLIPKLAGAAVGTGKWIEKHQGLTEAIAIGLPTMFGLSTALSGMSSLFGGMAKLSGALGVTFGQSVGAAFGTSFVGAALPVIMAGLAGFAIGSLIAEMIDAEGIGKKIYEWMHPEDTHSVEMTPAQAIADEKRRAAAAAGDTQNAQLSEGDPVLRNMAEDSAGAGMLAREPFNGKLEIMIRKDGKVEAEPLWVGGDGGLQVGVAVGVE